MIKLILYMLKIILSIKKNKPTEVHSPIGFCVLCDCLTSVCSFVCCTRFLKHVFKLLHGHRISLLSYAIEGVYLNSEFFGHQRGSSTIGYKKIDKGTLILSAQNLHLGNANINLRFEHGMISPAHNTYHIKGCDVNFMAQWIKREATKKFFFDATTTGASECRRNVMWDELYKQKIGVPSLPEQQKIADFLTSYDEAITAAKQELAKWKELKKGLLQQMFV